MGERIAILLWMITAIFSFIAALISYILADQYETEAIKQRERSKSCG